MTFIFIIIYENEYLQKIWFDDSIDQVLISLSSSSPSTLGPNGSPTVWQLQPVHHPRSGRGESHHQVEHQTERERERKCESKTKRREKIARENEN